MPGDEQLARSAASRMWEIVGGSDKGGVLVKQGKEMSSPQAPKRLATGSTVEELQLVGDRLQYRIMTGDGPPEGWISTVISKKVSARPVGAPLDAPIPRGPTEKDLTAKHDSAIGPQSDNAGGQTAMSMPSLDKVLSSIDRDAQADGGRLDVPSLDEILLSLERDAREEGDLADAEDTRQAFFELGCSQQLANVRPKRLPTKEELEVQAEIVTHLGKFSYGSMMALGEAILAENGRLQDPNSS